jgi:RNA polymerase sigma-70 factor (sigma-E family)
LDDAAERDFGDYVVARSQALCRFAFLLCGDWHRAEDAVQAAFAKLYLRWDRLVATGAVDPYVRRVVLTSIIDEGRRGWFRREAPSPGPPDRAAIADPAGASTDRLAVLGALAHVPPRQRAVLVLRYWEDLSIGQVAQLLACSEGTVKSQAARGLDRLRTLLHDPIAHAEEAV